MLENQKTGEVIEASTSGYLAQCYELYQSPPLGSLVKTRGDNNLDILGVVCNTATVGIEPGRRPIARGKDVVSEEEIYRSSPQLYKLLKSEFEVRTVGYSIEGRIYHNLPPKPARIHGFVYLCTEEEVRLFSRCLDFLSLLLNASVAIPVEELVIATLREMARSYGIERRSFLIEAGKELAVLLSKDYVRLKTILRGLRYDAGE
jgi:hypothetical protein